MFPILAIICFVLAFFHAPVPVDLIALGLVFCAAWMLAGNWPWAGRIPTR